VNAQGGVNGRKIVLESLDDGFEPKRSVENAQKLIDEKHVVSLFLFRGTANAEALMPVILEKKTPKRKRGFRKPMEISDHDAPRVKTLLGAKHK